MSYWGFGRERGRGAGRNPRLGHGGEASQKPGGEPGAGGGGDPRPGGNTGGEPGAGGGGDPRPGGNTGGGPSPKRSGSDPFADLRRRMVEEQLRARGIKSEAVLEVMGKVQRERFLPSGQGPLAYQDRALPFSHGQTVSQPYMVAVMTEALKLQPTDRVLEIGTGSGYQTAVLSPLASAVFSIERIGELSEMAYSVLAELACENVRLRVGDGTVGWPEEAPFDAILVTAGAPGVPESLLAQLAVGGRLVAPVGDRSVQELVLVTRTKKGHETEKLLACRFVPLVGEEGWESP